MNKKLNLLFGILLFCITYITAQEYPKVIFPGDYPDPSILRDGKDYYMTHSSFSYSPGFLIWHSQDLVNWEPLCRVNGAGMAPDLAKYGDTYYIYFPWGSTNYVVWAKDMKGPWSKPVNLKVKGIDPGHIVDKDGNRYLHLSEGTAVRLAKDGLSVIGTPVTVYEGWEYPKDWNTECYCLESPKLTYKDGYYYLTSAEGGTAGPATSHMVVSARARNVMGPWENSPYNPIVHTYSADDEWWSKGHGSLVDDVNGNWWIVYHAYAKDFHTLGRSTLLEPVEWTNDGWFRTKSTATLPSADTMSRKGISDISDDFSGKELDIRWSTFGSTPEKCTTLKNSSLLLQPKGDSPENGRVLLTIPTHKSYEAQVEVNIDKQNNGGLLLFYKPKVFAGIACNEKEFIIYNNHELYHRIPNTIGTHVFLKIVNKQNNCSIWISGNDKKWEKVADSIDVKQMNHNNYNGFRSLRIALYASGEGTVNFRDFRYTNRTK
jgi:glycosyl hydrolase